MNKIEVTRSARVVEAAPGETVLSAALRAGIDYPHSCMTGKCGACKSRLIEGEVEHLEHKKFTLTDQEKSLGLMLACRAVARTDIKVGWISDDEVQALPGRHFGRITRKVRLTHDVWGIGIEIRSGSAFVFRPGQFAMLQIGQLPARSYSMASQPNAKDLDFFVREVPNGLVSGYVGKTLEVGDEVSLKGPFGNSYLRRDHTGPILAVAGGSGLAPILSVVEGALRDGFKQLIRLYFGVREDRDVFLESRLSELERAFPNFSAKIVVDRGSQIPGRETGRVGDVVMNDLPSFEGDWRAYLAGPPPMVEGLMTALQIRGIEKGSIHADPFYMNQDDHNAEEAS